MRPTSLASTWSRARGADRRTTCATLLASSVVVLTDRLSRLFRESRRPSFATMRHTRCRRSHLTPPGLSPSMPGGASPPPPTRAFLQVPTPSVGTCRGLPPSLSCAGEMTLRPAGGTHALLPPTRACRCPKGAEHACIAMKKKDCCAFPEVARCCRRGRDDALVGPRGAAVPLRDGPRLPAALGSCTGARRAPPGCKGARVFCGQRPKGPSARLNARVIRARLVTGQAGGPRCSCRSTRAPPGGSSRGLAQ